jgi:hypothetical protein
LDDSNFMDGVIDDLILGSAIVVYSFPFGAPSRPL